MPLKLITPPTTEPVSLAEAKAHLRVDGADEDALIDGLITAARQHAEVFTRRAFITQTWELVLDGWPNKESIEIPLPPLRSIVSVTYTDMDGVNTLWDAANYIVDTDSEPGRLVLDYEKTWPAVTLQPAGGIRIRFEAGYGGSADVPQAIKQAMLLHIGFLYEQREAVTVGNIVNRLPLAYDALLWPYRVFSF